jgi:acyl-CoA thioesterase-1
LALAIATGVTGLLGHAALAAPSCQAPVSLLRFHAPLPVLAARLTAKKPVLIVALGSSSTQGIGASSPTAAYPFRLQAELRNRFPSGEINVVNSGIGGQLATDMLVRIKKDVLPMHPALVIWQTGVNDAMAHVDLAEFRKTVQLGVERMRAAGIDVVLLDMQYFPGAEKVRDFTSYLVTMRQIADQQKIPILQRFAIMKHLVTSAQFTARQLLAADLFHPNDLTYGCLGHMLADALQDEVAQPGAARAVVVAKPAVVRPVGEPVAVERASVGPPGAAAERARQAATTTGSIAKAVAQ